VAAAYFVLQEEENPRLNAVVALTDEDSPALEEVSLTFQRQIDDRVQERMPRAQECCLRLTRNPALLAFVARPRCETACLDERSLERLAE